MNRRDRRRLERQGKLPNTEPTYNLKASQMKDAVLNGPVRSLIRAEISKKLLDMDKQFTIDIDTMVLWTLYSRYGWRKDRLRRFYLSMFDEHMSMRSRYELNELYPERKKLKDAGIDVEAWYNELFNERGEYKVAKVGAE